MFFTYCRLSVLKSYKSLGKLITSNLNKKNETRLRRQNRRNDVRQFLQFFKWYSRKIHEQVTQQHLQRFDRSSIIWKLKPMALIPGWQSPLSVCSLLIAVMLNLRLRFRHETRLKSQELGIIKIHLSGGKNPDWDRGIGDYHCFPAQGLWREQQQEPQIMSVSVSFVSVSYFFLRIIFVNYLLSSTLLWLSATVLWITC